ncbi:hypothetical protein ACF08W_34645 [Streptomyces sp. NPDC015144]|uniref:hypothetical protein n=1 Tax=Streptomyces sp. NPDC015144 TaxID=3364944 RepID=UPI0036F6B26E
MPLPAWLQTKIGSVERTAEPPPVLARYLTVAGAPVAIRSIGCDASGDAVSVTVAECGGCPAAEYWPWADSYWADPAGEDEDLWSETEARTWAQTHAETCRALPMEG